MIKTAVILAAGMGTRIQKLLKDIPKGFMKIGGITLIERSINHLLDLGIKEIIIVTGYFSEYYETLKEKYHQIRTVKNEIYADSGSMYSFYCARKQIQNDMLLLESDLIYEKRAIQALIENNQKDIILVSGWTDSGDEVFVETDEKGLIKNLSKNKAELECISGELVGISKISFPLYQQMVSMAEKMFTNSLKVEYEQCLVATAQNYPIHHLKIRDLIWAEIDDENHLQRVKNKVFPLLQNANKRLTSSFK